jgi:hypothetical protein
MKYYYILDEKGTPVHEPDMMTWARWFATEDIKVAEDRLGEAKVVTVFLGLDYNRGDGPPILWETMVLGGPLDQEQERCSGSREQAEAMHAAMVAKVRQSGENARGMARELAAQDSESPTRDNG